MKSQSSLLLLPLLLVGPTFAQILTAGRALARVDTAVTCLAGDSGLKCNSCNTGLVCVGTAIQGTATCPAANSFCDTTTNSCSSTAPTTCGTSFKCPTEGYFPDPDRCNLYYFCTSELVAQPFDCPTNYVFDIATNGCKRQVYTTDCATLKCTTANEFLVYSKDASIYAYCDANKTPVIFKCATGLTFDKAAYGCKFVCKSEGHFPGATAQQAYFCYKEGLVLKYTLRTCPTGYEFNASYVCVRSTVADSA